MSVTKECFEWSSSPNRWRPEQQTKTESTSFPTAVQNTSQVVSSHRRPKKNKEPQRPRPSSLRPHAPRSKQASKRKDRKEEKGQREKTEKKEDAQKKPNDLSPRRLSGPITIAKLTEPETENMRTWGSDNVLKPLHAKGIRLRIWDTTCVLKVAGWLASWLAGCWLAAG